MGWSDRLPDPDAWEEYVEAAYEAADASREALEHRDLNGELGPGEDE